MKRRTLSLLMCLALVLSLAGGCFADSASPSWLNTTVYGNITEGMALNVKDDFNLAVNYEKLRDIVLPDDEPYYGTMAVAEALVQERIRALMTDDTLEGRDAQYIHILYNAYMDTETRNALGVAPVTELCKTIENLSSLADVTELMLNETAARHIAFPFHLAVVTGMNDPDQYIAGLSPAFFFAEDAAEYKELTPVGEAALEANEMMVLYLLQRCGYSEEKAVDMFANTLAAEAILANEAFTAEDRYSPDYYSRANNELTPDEAAALMPAFPLKEMMANYGFGHADQLLVKDLGYFRGFHQLYTEENLPLLKDYMIVHSGFLLTEYLDPECEDIAAVSGSMRYGYSSNESMEERAVRHVTGCLNEMVQRCYLEKYDAAEKKAVITDLCEKTIAEYKRMILEEDWLSDETKANALRKLETMKINAVFPEKWSDDSALMLTEGMNYFECMMAVEDYQRAQSIAVLGSGRDPELWDKDTLNVNANYDPDTNSISIFLGILSNDFYPEDGSVEKLYGGIGAVIGHEISHAFDKDGSQFDADGRLANWWTEEDYAAFAAKSQKAIDFYDGVTLFEGTNANGRLILGEATADMSGMKIMLRMAKNIENFDYDLFFRTFANIYATVINKEAAAILVALDAHPIGYLRVNVTVQQFDEFLDCYGITEGDGMYLPQAERILIW